MYTCFFSCCGLKLTMLLVDTQRLVINTAAPDWHLITCLGSSQRTNDAAGPAFHPAAGIQARLCARAIRGQHPSGPAAPHNSMTCFMNRVTRQRMASKCLNPCHLGGCARLTQRADNASPTIARAVPFLPGRAAQGRQYTRTRSRMRKLCPAARLELHGGLARRGGGAGAAAAPAARGARARLLTSTPRRASKGAPSSGTER